MSRFSNENDELLSCYFDGECNADEKAAVEKLIASDPAAALRLQHFESIRNGLKSLNQQRIGRDLSQTIIEQARRRARELTLPADHHLLIDNDPTSSATTPAVPNARLRNSSYARWALAGCALAASVLLAVAFVNSTRDIDRPNLVANQQPRPQATPFENTPGANSVEQHIVQDALPNVSTSEQATRTVGQNRAPAPESLRLVIDVTVLPSAWNNNSLAKILENANIRAGQAFVADKSMIDSLEKSLMIMSAPQANPTGTRAPRIALLYVEAPAAALDKAMSVIYARNDEFPQVALNIAFTRPGVELFSQLKTGVDSQSTELANSPPSNSSSVPAGRALPIVVRSSESNDTASNAQFSGSPSAPHYVLRSERSKGWPAMSSTSTDMNPWSEVLFVIREHLPQ